MNIAELQTKLLAAARAQRPSETVPYAFEKRIMARVRAKSGADPWSFWGSALWRAAASCVGIMVLAALWTYVSGNPNFPTDSFAVALEETVLAPLDNAGDVW